MKAMNRELAVVEQAKAFQIGEFLLMRLAGTKPNGCYVVDVEQSLLTVEPPAFIATWFIRPDARCVPEPVPYEYQEVFLVGVRRDTVILHEANGDLSVEVEELTPAEGVTPPEPGFPPFADGVPGQSSEAVGYSENFDFGEAFRDAIRKIPVPAIPDWLARYSVVETGAEIGGIAGFNHLYVRVRGG